MHHVIKRESQRGSEREDMKGNQVKSEKEALFFSLVVDCDENGCLVAVQINKNILKKKSSKKTIVSN